MIKGVGKRAGASKMAKGAGVKVQDWARQFMVEQECQDQFAAKAFTGRGKFLELRQYLAELDRVEQEMLTLVALTKQVQGHWIYLMQHSHRSGLTFLRWRERAGGKRHLGWEEAALTCQGDGVSVELQQWYAEVSKRAARLNEMHKDSRRAIGMARAVIKRTSPHIFAKPIPGKPPRLAVEAINGFTRRRTS